jgi:hypothetical protein
MLLVKHDARLTSAREAGGRQINKSNRALLTVKLTRSDYWDRPKKQGGGGDFEETDQEQTADIMVHQTPVATESNRRLHRQHGAPINQTPTAQQAASDRLYGPQSS